MKTHTRADGSYVDAKAEKVTEVYKKTCEERLIEIDDDGPENSANTSEQSTHRDLIIEENNEIFLQCTEKDQKGNHFGLGSLVQTHGKGKRKERFASSSSSTIVEL
ncbi:putative transposase, Ptta/En/Spm, plant [Arabidopsis thaliana]